VCVQACNLDADRVDLCPEGVVLVENWLEVEVDEGRHKVHKGGKGHSSGDDVFIGGRSATDYADGAKGGVGADRHLGRKLSSLGSGVNLRYLRIFGEEC